MRVNIEENKIDFSKVKVGDVIRTINVDYWIIEDEHDSELPFKLVNLIDGRVYNAYKTIEQIGDYLNVVEVVPSAELVLSREEIDCAL